jgi:phage baseplate assembly protein W
MSFLLPQRIYKDLDLNFTLHPDTHDVAKTLDVNAVKQSLFLLLNTHFGERLFHPERGSPIPRILFEPIDPITTEVLKRSIEQVIQNHEPRVTLDRLDVTAKEEDNAYFIYLQVNIVGIPTPITFSFTLQRIR